MGIEHPYLAILALIMFVAGVMGVIYLYMRIYSETLKTPVLSVSAISCYNNTSTILHIIVKHERGDVVKLQKIHVTSDVGLIDVDVDKQYQDIYIEMVNFNRLLYPGQIGKITITFMQRICTENRLCHAVLYFDRTTAIASFEVTSCEKLLIGIGYPQLYTATAPYTTTLIYTETLSTTITTITTVATTLPPYTVTLTATTTITPPTYLLITAPPSITLEYPPNFPHEISIARTSRGTLVYTDFESVSHPMPGWRTHGGSWVSASATDIAKGYVLQGSDDSRGLGGASYYYSERRFDSYNSLWVAAKARRTAVRDWFGIVLLNSDTTRAYVVGVEDDTSELEIRSYNVENPGGWRTLHQSRFSYVRGNWYVIVTRYSVTTISVVIDVWVYGRDGVLIASTTTSSTSTNRFTPAYIGVFVDGPTAQFDDFIVSTRDPRIILFNLPEPGMRVEIWDNLGNLVASTTAIGTQLSLNVLLDTVIGTGRNGRILIKTSTNAVFAEYRALETDAILGGDVYEVAIISTNYISKFAAGTGNLFAYVSLSLPTNTYVYNLYVACLRGNATARLKLIDYTILAEDTVLAISLVAENFTGTMQGIEIVGTSIYSNSTPLTDIVNRGYIAVSGSTPGNVILYLLLEYYSPTNLSEPIAHIPIILEFKTT